MRSKWAAGIEPRNFVWVIKDRLAGCERPGGYARNHRRIRRQEEIIWIREQGFARVISLLPSNHNLHAYDELNVRWEHIPFAPTTDPHVILPDLYGRMRQWLGAGEKLLLHQEEFGDVLAGVMAGFLIYSGLIDSGPQAITILERLTHRQMGPPGRELVAVTPELRA